MSLADFVPQLEALGAHGKPAALTAADELVTLITRGQAIAAALAAVEVGAATRVAVPFAEVQDLGRDLDGFYAHYFADLDYPVELFAALRVAQGELFGLTFLRRRFAAMATEGAADDDAPIAPTGARVPYLLRQGDTLERLAGKFLSDPSRWPEIVALNGLVFPFLVTDRTFKPRAYSWSFDPDDYHVRPRPDRTGIPDGVKVTGEVIWLPPDAQVPGDLGPFTPRDVELYGRDIMLLEGLPALTPDGELEVVAGKANIVQALRQRIGSLQGELVLHPDYGMARLLVVGVEGTRDNVTLSGLELARTCGQDPRVIQVRNLGVLFRDTLNTASMRVSLIGPGEREVPLNLVVPDTMAA